MPKYFVDQEYINENENKILVTGDTAFHIIKVLRMKINDELIICDGFCNDYFCTINELSKTEIVANIKRKEIAVEPKIKVTLFQGLPKSDKMDFIIQKSIELGAYKIVPVITKNTVVKIDINDKKAVSKLSKYQKQSLSAAEQCMRGIIPKIDNFITFDKAIEEINSLDYGFILYENEDKTSLKNVIEHIKNENSIESELSIGIFIGPEGGFTPLEIDKCTENNINSVSLGKRILRTETAGITVISILMYEFNELDYSKSTYKNIVQKTQK